MFDVLSQTGDWWLGKLIRDVPRGDMSRGTEGWVPSTFMDVFQGQLSYEEEAYLKWGDAKSMFKCSCVGLPVIIVLYRRVIEVFHFTNKAKRIIYVIIVWFKLVSSFYDFDLL